MADIERLSIALPAPMAAIVRRAVEDGEYASASEVIRDALRLWDCCGAGGTRARPAAGLGLSTFPV